jgi:RNA polymerase sigma factor (sigma-70 family)
MVSEPREFQTHEGSSVSSLAKDRGLLAKVISGDRVAREVFVRRFSNLVYQCVQSTYITKHISYTRQDLEDLHNTVFLELFDRGCRKLKQYEGRNGCSLASWIRIVAIRIVLNHLRRKGHDAPAWQERKQALEDFPEIRGDSVEPLALMEKKHKERLLRKGIRSLPPRDRLFMKLHFDQGLSLEDVALAMQISVGNAYTVKHRAIQKLKAYVATGN